MDRVIAMEVTGYQIRHGADTLGAAGTGNAVLLHLTFDTAWDGMVKTAKFTDARGDGGVTTELELLTRNGDGSYTLPVPREAMAYEGTAELTLIGEITEGGVVVKRLTTKPLALRVYGSGADREAQNVQPITATDKQQILAKVDAAEAYARGTVDGLPVPECAEDNARYYKEQASASAEAAEGAAATAGNQAAAALGYRNGAQTFASRASGFAATAEAGKIAAETAQGKAEDAQTAADASALEALASSQTAQAWAEGKRGDAAVPSTDPAYHNNAKYWSEQAAQTLSSAQELLNDLNTHRYDAFASETQSVEVQPFSGDPLEIYTDIGAEGIPIEAASITVDAGLGTVKIRHIGKNLFDPNTTFTKDVIINNAGEIVTNANHMVSDFIPVMPGKTYVLNGAAVNGAGLRIYLAFYTAAQEGCSANCRIQSALADTELAPFTTPSNCNFIRFTSPKQRYDNGHISMSEPYGKPVQLEIGTAATAYIPYFAQDVTSEVDGAGTYNAQTLVATSLGANTFRVVADDDSEDPPIVSGLHVTYRLDPTLAYDKLKAAIVAAGTT